MVMIGDTCNIGLQATVLQGIKQTSVLLLLIRYGIFAIPYVYVVNKYSQSQALKTRPNLRQT